MAKTVIKSIAPKYARGGRLLALVLFLLFWAHGPALAQAEPLPELDTDVIRTLPTQTGGRLKPLDTTARETVKAITGKSSFNKQDPVWTLLVWWAKGEATLDAEVVEVRNLELKKTLGLDAEKRWFSVNQLESSNLDGLRDTLHKKLRQEEALTPLEEKAAETLSRMEGVRQVADGHQIHLVPNPNGLNEAWASIEDLYHPEVIEEVLPLRETVDRLRAAILSGDSEAFQAASTELHARMAEVGKVPSQQEMVREVRYNNFHPFRKAWIAYLIGFLCLLFVPSEKTNGLYLAGLVVSSLGFAMHCYGFYLRCMIAGRPPVTNMYESVIWVAFGAVLFSLVFEYIYRSRIYLLASTGGAVICLILADALPAALDPTIAPLTPVLRNNFWLTVHVLTITLGYAAFLLALGLGHMAVWRYLKPGHKSEQVKGINEALYRALQVGVLFLAAGTILGGVWANYSWGRFWGWDPKEVWALIALLGYLAILHGRYAGWLREFGMAAWSIIAFQGVLMAWYGVNYVLGAGLHSYGFGTGGMQYVGTYVLAECLFVLWAWRRRKSIVQQGQGSTL